MLALLLCACACLAGCGIQGEPLPPLINLPMIPEVQGQQRGDRVLLSWTMPRQTTEGRPIKPDQLGAAEVFMVIVPGLHREVARAEFGNAQRVASVPVAQLQKPVIDLSVNLPEGRAGGTAAYAVKLPNEHGHDAGFSNVIVVPLVSPPPAPGSLSVNLTEQAIELAWPAVPNASSYRVYRAVDDGPFQPCADVPAGSGAIHFRDDKFEFGKIYKYVVRSIAAVEGFTAESSDSAPAEALAKDTFAPKAPVRLVAVAIDRGVELSWEPNTETDLAGYNIYRSDGNGAPHRLNTDLLVSPAFRDSTAQPGGSYAYTVTAVDQSGNESGKSESAVAKP